MEHQFYNLPKSQYGLNKLHMHGIIGLTSISLHLDSKEVQGIHPFLHQLIDVTNFLIFYFYVDDLIYMGIIMQV